MENNMEILIIGIIVGILGILYHQYRILKVIKKMAESNAESNDVIKKMLEAIKPAHHIRL